MRKPARQGGGDLLLAAPRQQMTQVLAIARPVDAFSVYASVAEAACARGSLGIDQSTIASCDAAVPFATSGRP
jgi:hypothetical protein